MRKGDDLFVSKIHQNCLYLFASLEYGINLYYFGGFLFLILRSNDGIFYIPLSAIWQTHPSGRHKRQHAHTFTPLGHGSCIVHCCAIAALSMCACAEHSQTQCKRGEKFVLNVDGLWRAINNARTTDYDYSNTWTMDILQRICTIDTHQFSRAFCFVVAIFFF